MNKKNNLPIIIVIVLVAFLSFSLLIYQNFYQDKVDIFQTYLNVYQELDQDINAIHIISNNHDVIFKASSDNKIHIDYYQKLDNTNSLKIEKGEVTLTMPEQVEDVDSIFFSKTKELKTITISLPIEKFIYIENSSVSGDFTVDGLNVRTCRFTSSSGVCQIVNSSIETIIFSSESGSIQIYQSSSKLINITTVTADIYLDLNHSIADYKTSIKTEHGSLLINKQAVLQQQVDGQLTESNIYVNNVDNAAGTLNIDSHKGNIQIIYPQ